MNDPWANPSARLPRRTIPCQGECEGKNAASCNVVVGHDWRYGKRSDRTKPMCHSCAVKERAEKDAGHADD